MSTAAPRSTFRDLPALSIRAAINPASINLEKRTVDVVWSTGARVRRGFWEPYEEELSMEPGHVRMVRLQSGKAPVLNNHDSWSGVGSQLGVVERASVNGKEGTATLRFAKAEDDPEADVVFRKIADKIIANLSVGYRVHKLEKIEPGNSLAGTLPVYRATDWEPFEISPVLLPADPGAGFRSAEQRGESQITNRCEVVTRSEDHEMTTPVVAPAAAPAVTPAPETRAAPAAAPSSSTPDAAALAAARAEGARAENVRVEGIRAAVKKAKLSDEFAAELLGRKDPISLDDARAAILDKLAGEADEVRTDPVHSGAQVGDGDHDKFLRYGAGYLVQRIGMAQVFRDAAKADKAAGLDGKRFELDLDAGPLRGMTLREVARHTLERRGSKIPNGIDTMVGAALTKRFGGQSTSDFAILLENTLNKVLLAAYAVTPDKWRAFCKIGSVGDFKPSPRYRTGSFGRLDPLGEGGEFQHKEIPDGEKNTVQVATFGNLIALTRQAIINDDLGAFDTLAVALGRAAKLTIELDVFETLLLNGGLGPTMADALPLFDAGHNNIGTGGALSVASVDVDRVAMLGQTDPSGNEMLEITPSVLLVPAGLGGLARVINGSQFDPTANAAQGRPNMVVGLYDQVIDTRRLTGTRRYSFAKPSIAPVFEVTFLNGVEEPFLEQKDEFTVDGTTWKVRMDYGVDVVDYRGAVTNAGT